MAINDNEQQYYQLFQELSDLVLIYECLPDGTPGRYLEMNRSARGILGYDEEELCRLSPFDIDRAALEDVDAFAQILNELQAAGEAIFRTDLLCKDGSWAHVEISCRQASLHDKIVYLAVARDLSLRDKYEDSIKALVRSTVGLTGQECLEEIVKNLCLWLNVDGACIGVFNDDQLQIRASYFAGTCHPPSHLSIFDAPFSELLQGQFCFYPRDAGLLFPSLDASQLCGNACFIGFPMRAHDGRILGAVCAYSKEPLPQVAHVEELLSIIASRAAAECERLHYVRELSHSEEMLRTLFNSTAEAIVGIDLEGRVAFCNPSTLLLLGHNEEADLVGQCFWKLTQPPAKRDSLAEQSVQCPFIAAIVQGKKISNEDGFFYRNDGARIPVEYWGHPMFHDQQLVGGVVTFIDISRRKILEKQLQQSQRMEAIGTLTGGIAHDFNNILTVISGYVGLLKAQYADQDKLLSKISKIGQAAERGSKLTHGLLAYSRKKSEPSTPVDLNQLILKVHDLFGQVIGERIQHVLTLGQDKMVVLADASQLEQVLLNLATNARDAMPDGGILTIKTELAEIDSAFCDVYGYGEPGLYALISVMDTGIGIPKDLQQKIFDPFFTTKDTGKGTGLGLAMAWGIVKQHKGYILAESSKEEGTCFKIYLPLTDREAHLQPIQQHAQLPGGKETILLVEDDPLVRESTHSILSAVGYEVIDSDCAESALAILDKERGRLALVLSDVVMPGIKGPEFFQEIRKKSAIPVIFMSGYTFDSLREQGLVREGVPLLNKPIQPLELLTLIRDLLDLLPQAAL